MSKLDTSHLVLKPVMINGKLQHRWVNPINDEEHAPFGTKIKFQHHGKTMTGTVGSVIKTGEYAVKGENGTVYNKHRHQFELHKEEEPKLEKYDFKQFVDLVKKSKSFEEAYKNAQNIKGISIEESKAFAKKYDPKDELTPKQAFEKFYNENKPSGNLIHTEGDFHVKIEAFAHGFEFVGKLPIELKIQRKDKENKVYWGSPVFPTSGAAEAAIQRFNERQAKEIIEVKKFNQESTTKERILKGFKNSISGYPVIVDILTQSIPHLEKIIENYREQDKKVGKIFTAKEQEVVELGLLKDLVGSLGNYIAKTDKAKEIKFQQSKGTIAITADILRDGKSNHFSTQMIYAGGHTIQVLHFRYIVDTKLPHRFNVPLKAIEAKIKHKNTEEKIKEQIQTEQNLIDRYTGDLKKYESKTREQSDQEVIDEAVKNKFPLKFEDLDKTSIAYKRGKESFLEDIKYYKNRGWERIQNSIKSTKSSLKEIEKKKAKLEQKLKEHLASEAQYENPSEGDTKIIRDKKDYRNHYPIHIHQFKEGNWKNIRTTTVANVKKHGFNSAKDEDILAYHKKRNEEKS